MRTLVLVALVALAGGQGLSAQAPHAARDLRLGPGDAVRLEVGDEPDLGGDYPIDDAGTVLLPLVGLVEVAGIPFSEVRARLLSLFEAELVDTAVRVTPLVRIPVLGEVRRPGLLSLDATYSLAEVLASAGGLTPDADPDEILLFRPDGSRRLALGAPGGGDLTLLPGDQIVVGRRSWVSRNASVLLSVGGSVLAAVLTSLILR